MPFHNRMTMGIRLSQTLQLDTLKQPLSGLAKYVFAIANDVKRLKFKHIFNWLHVTDDCSRYRSSTRLQLFRL